MGRREQILDFTLPSPGWEGGKGVIKIRGRVVWILPLLIKLITINQVSQNLKLSQWQICGDLKRFFTCGLREARRQLWQIRIVNLTRDLLFKDEKVFFTTADTSAWFVKAKPRPFPLLTSVLWCEYSLHTSYSLSCFPPSVRSSDFSFIVSSSLFQL